MVVSQADGMNWLTVDQNGNLMTEFKGARGKPLISQTTISDGRWHRVALVWDGAYRSLYVDDELVATDTAQQGAPKTSKNRLHIGAGSDPAPGTLWSGLIDDVRVYSRALIP